MKEDLFMVSFFICLFILIAGYALYGRYVERQFGPDDRVTPAVALADGSDYVVTYVPEQCNDEKLKKC